MRRTVLAVLAALVLPLAAAPADAAPTTASIRIQREALVARIAALTDEAARAQVRASDAQRRAALSATALVDARARFARYAVDAYLDSVQAAELDQLRRRAWADTLAETDLEIVGDLRAARDLAEKQAGAARAALAEAREARADLDLLRLQLERTLEDRVRYEAALARNAAKARATALRAAGAARVPRHQRATMSQHELMQTYRFGPTATVPEGLVATGDAFEGRASWYGPGFDGRPTASGAIFDQEGWTVAHRTLPLGTILLVSRNGRSVVVLVNDRGPFVNGRVLDLSHGVAEALGTVQAGVASVRAEILVPA